MFGFKCPNCPFRAAYDKNSQSVIGQIWRWHIEWCPGWAKYIANLPEDERAKLIKKYNWKLR